MRRRWTEDEIIQALQRYADLIGDTPAALRVDRDVKHLGWLPYAHSVRRVFGTWSAGLEAAGLTTRKWTRADDAD